MSGTQPTQQNRSRLVFGVSLLIIGGVLLALNLGVNLPWHIWKYFPIPMLVLGLWSVLSPTRHLDRVGGLWLFTSGVYCLIGVFDLFGLGWERAWPLFIVATGISLVIPRGNANQARCEAARKE